MLSRVAERIYWSARYLERVENTARLVSVYDNLLFDLPKDTNISWYNLIRINSSEQLFHDRYTVQDEHNVVKFMLADDTNLSSMLSSLNMLRENIRTTRDVLPQDTWELVNELDLFAQNNIRQGINRTHRHQFLNTIIQKCQELNGLFDGTMSRDPGWQFLMLGRNLERADMTTRILDAGISVILQPNEGSALNIAQVVWGNVLRSLSADMNYRRSVRSAVQSRKVARFLLQDKNFPRSFAFCIDEIQRALNSLPRADKIKLKSLLQPESPLQQQAMPNAELQEFLNELQILLIELNNQFAQTWFAFDNQDTVPAINSAQTQASQA
ncbi:alpha-E domain-containing protein [Neptuniibacter halophilus]|uniref:alpha-E domain-containing protein n=1 Tax=Neptuniibacter halophilus TaxID=651666 RepID=UPI002572C558|nr:alpha-E domain-containing protein [Neptuniibacter halophilus]